MLMDLIKERHSIRKYTDEQVSLKDLELILEAGNYAPNAGGGQRSNIDDSAIKNGFYGAPCVIAIFAQDDFMFRVADAFCCAENMLLQATELGLSSCIISRGKETFENERGRILMKEWGVPENYSCVCFVILGYIKGEQPHTKPRRPGRIKIVE